LQRPHEGLQRQHEGPQRVHKASQRPHEGLQRPHEGLQREHEASQREHEASQRVHEASQRVHEASQRVHEASQREHEASQRVHEASQRVHEASQRVHEASQRVHEASQREHEASQREHEASQREHEASQRVHEGPQLGSFGVLRVLGASVRDPSQASAMPGQGGISRRRGAGTNPARRTIRRGWHPSGVREVLWGDGFRWCRFAQPPATGSHPCEMQLGVRPRTGALPATPPASLPVSLRSPLAARRSLPASRPPRHLRIKTSEGDRPDARAVPPCGGGHVGQDRDGLATFLAGGSGDGGRACRRRPHGSKVEELWSRPWTTRCAPRTRGHPPRTGIPRPPAHPNPERAPRSPPPASRLPPLASRPSLPAPRFPLPSPLFP
jgi:hypothetical protein